MRKTVTNQVRSKVVQMYLDHVPVAEITRQTGTPRGTIYMLLKQEGIHPDRTGRALLGESPQELIDQLRAAEREIGSLREQLAEAQRRAMFFQYVAMLLDQLGMTPPPGSRAWVPDLTGEPVPAERGTLLIELKSKQPTRPRPHTRKRAQ